MKGIKNMNSVDMQTLIKIVLGCVILFLFSPLILSIFGVIAKIILWAIIAIVLLITFSVMYFKHKAKKSEDGFYSVTFGDKKEDVDVTASNSYQEQEDDFNTTNVIDVDYKEADEEK